MGMRCKTNGPASSGRVACEARPSSPSGSAGRSRPYLQGVTKSFGHIRAGYVLLARCCARAMRITGGTSIAIPRGAVDRVDSTGAVCAATGRSREWMTDSKRWPVACLPRECRPQKTAGGCSAWVPAVPMPMRRHRTPAEPVVRKPPSPSREPIGTGVWRRVARSGGPRRPRP